MSPAARRFRVVLRACAFGLAAAPLAVSGQSAPPPSPASVATAAPAQSHNDLPMPDAKLTPGGIADSDIKDICFPGFADRQGYIAPGNVRETFARYHIPPPLQLHRFVIDRLVPVSLGGSGDLPNLWAIPLEAERRKRAIEQSLFEAVCSGLVPLAEAQHRMLTDWRTAVTW